MITCYGVVPLRKINRNWHVYIVKRTQGFWEIPKGHAEQNETPLQAATRELFEETHLRLEKLLLQKPLEIHYSFTKNELLHHKTVLYFVAEVSGEGECDGKETVEGKWLPLKNAEELVTYPSTKRLLSKVVETLVRP